MPIKKPAKPNAFFLFLLEVQDTLQTDSNQKISLDQCKDYADPIWRELSQEMRDFYKKTAKNMRSESSHSDHWRQHEEAMAKISQKRRELGYQTVTNPPKQHRKARPPIQNLKEQIPRPQFVDLEPKRRADRKELHDKFIWHYTARELKEDVRFFLISMESFCSSDTGHHYPAEMSVVEYSLEKGVLSEWHSFIQPPDIPAVSSEWISMARVRCENVLKIPHCVTTANEEQYSKITQLSPRAALATLYRYLNVDLSNSPGPVLYFRSSQAQHIFFALEYLKRQYGEKSERFPLKRLYCVEDLAWALLKFGTQYNANISLIQEGWFSEYANHPIMRSEMRDSACEHHVSADVPPCTMREAKRMAFILSLHLKNSYNINFSDGYHCPPSLLKLCSDYGENYEYANRLSEKSQQQPAAVKRSSTDVPPDPFQSGATIRSCGLPASASNPGGQSSPASGGPTVSGSLMSESPAVPMSILQSQLLDGTNNSKSPVVGLSAFDCKAAPFQPPVASVVPRFPGSVSCAMIGPAGPLPSIRGTSVLPNFNPRLCNPRLSSSQPRHSFPPVPDDNFNPDSATLEYTKQQIRRTLESAKSERFPTPSSDSSQFQSRLSSMVSEQTMASGDCAGSAGLKLNSAFTGGADSNSQVIRQESATSSSSRSDGLNEEAVMTMEDLQICDASFGGSSNSPASCASGDQSRLSGSQMAGPSPVRPMGLVRGLQLAGPFGTAQDIANVDLRSSVEVLRAARANSIRAQLQQSQTSSQLTTNTVSSGLGAVSRRLPKFKSKASMRQDATLGNGSDVVHGYSDPPAAYKMMGMARGVPLANVDGNGKAVAGVSYDARQPSAPSTHPVGFQSPIRASMMTPASTVQSVPFQHASSIICASGIGRGRGRIE